MPEVTFLRREGGVERTKVQVQHGAIGVARVVLGNRVAQGMSVVRAGRLQNVANIAVDGCLELLDRLLRIALVVERDQLEVSPQHAAVCVDANSATKLRIPLLPIFANGPDKGSITANLMVSAAST